MFCTLVNEVSGHNGTMGKNKASIQVIRSFDTLNNIFARKQVLTVFEPITSNAGLQYRHRRVNKDIQTPGSIYTPTLAPTHKHLVHSFFPTFQLDHYQQTDGPMNRRTNQTDKTSYNKPFSFLNSDVVFRKKRFVFVPSLS